MEEVKKSDKPPITQPPQGLWHWYFRPVMLTLTTGAIFAFTVWLIQLNVVTTVLVEDVASIKQIQRHQTETLENQGKILITATIIQERMQDELGMLEEHMHKCGDKCEELKERIIRLEAPNSDTR